VGKPAGVLSGPVSAITFLPVVRRPP